MKQLVAAIALLLVFGVTVAAADSFVELQILQAYFGGEGIKNRTQVYGGEMAERYLNRPTIGEALPAENIATFRLLEEGPVHAVYLATVETAERIREWSTFFQRGPLGSRLVAVKTLNTPPFLYGQEFRQLAERGSARSEAEEGRFQRLNWLFSSSPQLMQYFIDHRQEFEKVAEFVESDRLDEARSRGRALNFSQVRIFGDKKTEGEIALLTTAAVVRGGKGPNLQVGSEIRLGEFFESAVGFIHLPPGILPPVMNARDYILIEPAGVNGWYLFRNVAVAPPETEGGKGKERQ